LVAIDARLRLRHLQCFLAIAEHQSVQEAAKMLHQTPSAVSKSVTELENILGMVLIVRHRSGSELTAAGTQFLSYAQQSLNLLSEGIVKVWGQTQRGPHLRIGILPTASRILIPRALEHLLDVFEQVEVSIYEGLNRTLIQRLHEKELDLIVGGIASPDYMSGLKFEQLYNEPLMLAVRLGHPLLAQLDQWKATFHHYPFLLPSAGTNIRRRADLFLVAQGLPAPAKVIQTMSKDVATMMLKRDAIWFSPRGVIQPLIEENALTCLPIDTSSTLESVGITTRRDAEYRPLIAEFIQVLKVLCSDTGDAASA